MTKTANPTPPQRRFEPMLARSAGSAWLKQKGYLFEPKLDGIRALLYYDHGKVRVVNRRGRDVTGTYHELQNLRLPVEKAVLDGELICFDEEGKPDFYLLLQRENSTAPKLHEPCLVQFGAFDLLSLNGQDLTDLTLLERKQIMEQHLEPNLPLLDILPYTTDGRKLWDFVVRHGMEGVMAKDPASSYHTGKRSSDWLKIKLSETIDAIVVGYTSDKRLVSSLALAAWEGGRLRFLGKVSSGITERGQAHLSQQLEKLHTAAPAVQVPRKYQNLTWVRPELVCEVRFHSIGADGMMRHPVFLRWRPDKAPHEAVLDLAKPDEERKKRA